MSTWTSLQKVYLLENMARKSLAEIAADLGRTEGEVRAQIKHYGLEKPYVRAAISVAPPRGPARLLRSLRRRTLR